MAAKNQMVAAGKMAGKYIFSCIGRRFLIILILFTYLAART